MIIDLHCDTVSHLYKYPECGNLKQNEICVDLEKLKKGHSLAQFFALFVNRTEAEDPMAYALLLLDSFYREMEKNSADIALALNGSDLERHRREGKISAFLTIEEGGVLRGSLAHLRNFYRLGVRLVTLTWNYPNEIGFPNHAYQHQRSGLTEFGRECVREMNRLGMIVDVSHLSDQGFYDVLEAAAKPFVASHSNSRAMTPHSRNLTDEMIRRLADKGGVAGLNFSSGFLGGSPISRIADMMRHIRHMYRVGGIDVLAIGSDFDGIDPRLEIADFGEMDKFCEALKASGFHESEVEKICCKNAMRVIESCLSP